MENKIMSVQDYNRKDMALYEDKVNEWRNDSSDNSIIPQSAFFGFRNSNNGELLKRGYVITGGNHAVYGKTQKEAKRLFNY